MDINLGNSLGYLPDSAKPPNIFDNKVPIGEIITNDIYNPAKYKAKAKKLNTKLITHDTLLLPDSTIMTYDDILKDPTLEIILPEDWMAFNYDLSHPDNQLYMLNKQGLEIPIREGDVTYKMIEHYCNGRQLKNLNNFCEVRDCFTATGKYHEETSPKRIEQFWLNELDKCLNGVKDYGDYITGYNYFYWNYAPIDKAVKIDAVRSKLEYGFADLWDIDYYFFHYVEEAIKLGLHALVPKARRKGMSYKAGSMLNRNYHCIARSKGFAIADLSDFLNDDGVISKAWAQMNFIDMHTGFGTNKQVHNTQEYKKASYWYFDEEDERNIRLEGGMLSEIFAISTKGNVNKLRGKAGQLFVLEEFGSNAQGENTLTIIRSSVEQGNSTYGLILAYGTSGDAGPGFAALEKFVTSPSSMNFHAIKNMFKSSALSTDIGFFIPDNICRYGTINEDGNCDHIRAAVDVGLERLKFADDPSLSMKFAAEHPLSLEEFCLTVTGDWFPSVELKHYLSELKVNPRLNKVRPEHGKLYKLGEAVRFDGTAKVIPINTFPYLEKNRDGCVTIFSHPQVTYNGHLQRDEVLPNRYIAALDPVDWNADEVSRIKNRTSLQSMFVLDTITRNIVAEYTGRPNDVDVFFDQARLLLDYYNSKLLLEVNIRGALAYFKSRHLEGRYLAPPPKVLTDKLNYKPSVNFGVRTDTGINAFGRGLINQWLMEDVYIVGENKEELITVPRYTLIKSIPLLEELILWNPKGNFDRISALQLLLIFLLEADTYSSRFSSSSSTTNSATQLSKFLKSADSKIAKGIASRYGTNVSKSTALNFGKRYKAN